MALRAITHFAPYKMLSNVSYHPARPSLRRCAISHGNLTPLQRNSFNSFKGVIQTSKGRQRTQNPAQKPAIGQPMNSKRINQMITHIAFMISWYFLGVVLLYFISCLWKKSNYIWNRRYRYQISAMHYGRILGMLRNDIYLRDSI